MEFDPYQTHQIIYVHYALTNAQKCIHSNPNHFEIAKLSSTYPTSGSKGCLRFNINEVISV